MRPTPFNASGIATVRSKAALTIPDMDPAFSTPSESRSAARAILRHKLHTKNKTTTSGASDGLHPFYMELHGRGHAQGVEFQEATLIVKDSFHDLLDAVSTFCISAFLFLIQ